MFISVFKFLSVISDTFLAENVTTNNRLGADSKFRTTEPPMQPLNPTFMSQISQQMSL